jgi:toxin YhaV
MPGAFDRRHGWRLFLHPAFKGTFDRLVAELAELAELEQARPRDHRSHPKAKLLRRIVDLILDEIPSDRASPKYRQGTTLGGAHRHWRRAKFLRRFRLFFRYSEKERIIIYAWINDENTLRMAGVRSDPYAVFRRRLSGGDPPDSWDDLMREAGPKR